jgi:ribonuclease BN (tRNA processing enzyme)
VRQVVALGSGDAFSSAGRANTAWLVEDGAPACAVDFGPTALLAMKKLGRDPRALAAVHFTHLHGDHIGGWPLLLVDAVYRARRSEPLDVTGPPGTAERLQALWSASYADAAARPLPFELRIRELSPGEAADVCGRRIETLRAEHQRPPHVALMLRLTGPAGTIAFTGDTGPQEGLFGLARGAALLCAECTELRAPPEAESRDPGASRRHLAWDDLRAALPRLEVRRIALGHLGAEVRREAASIEAEAHAAGRDLRVCDDGTAVPLD